MIKLVWLLVNNPFYLFINILFNGLDCTQMSRTKRENCVDVDVVLMINKPHVFVTCAVLCIHF